MTSVKIRPFQLSLQVAHSREKLQLGIIALRHYAGNIWKQCFLSLIKCFLFTVGQRNLKTQQSPVILDLCLRKNRAGKSHDNRFWKASFSTCFSSTVKRKAGVFKFLRFQKRFRKAPFLWRISVDGRLNPRSKAGVFKILRRRRCSRCFLSGSGMSSDVWRNNFL